MGKNKRFEERRIHRNKYSEFSKGDWFEGNFPEIPKRRIVLNRISSENFRAFIYGTNRNGEVIRVVSTYSETGISFLDYNYLEEAIVAIVYRGGVVDSKSKSFENSLKNSKCPEEVSGEFDEIQSLLERMLK